MACAVVRGSGCAAAGCAGAVSRRCRYTRTPPAHCTLSAQKPIKIYKAIIAITGHMGRHAAVPLIISANSNRPSAMIVPKPLNTSANEITMSDNCYRHIAQQNQHKQRQERGPEMPEWCIGCVRPGRAPAMPRRWARGYWPGSTQIATPDRDGKTAHRQAKGTVQQIGKAISGQFGYVR